MTSILCCMTLVLSMPTFVASYIFKNCRLEAYARNQDFGQEPAADAFTMETPDTSTYRDINSDTFARIVCDLHSFILVWPSMLGGGGVVH